MARKTRSGHWTGFRSGQWVKFRLVGVTVPATAHATRDGFLVGIYQHAGKDATGEWADERIILQGSDGKNVSAMVGDDIVSALSFSPFADSVRELQPLLDREDLPPGRKGTHPNWQPAP